MPPGIAIGKSKMSGVDFELTIHVGANAWDNDWVGTIFSFQVRNSSSGVFLSRALIAGKQIPVVNEKK